MSSDAAEEAERRRQMHDLERRTASQPEQPGPDRPDPIHVLRVRWHDRPGVESYFLARWSLIARLHRDAQGSGDRLKDLGPDALMLAQAAQRGEWAPGDLVKVGDAKGGKWLRWLPPAPVEPVPGSRQARAQRN
jgi:hypothetical protein